MPLSEQEQTELNELKERFRSVLPQRLAIIQACRQQDQPYVGDSLKTLFREVHQLAGTGKAFGFPGISDLAEPAELLLRRLVDGEIGQPGSELLQELTARLEGLCEELMQQSGQREA